MSTNKVLCIKREELSDYFNLIPKKYDPAGNHVAINSTISFKVLNSLKKYFIERSVAEVSPEYIQIIPYAVIYKVDIAAKFSLLTYRRGSGSGEQRLLNKCSIGFGGHIDESENYNSANINDINIVDVITEETKRELSEELDINDFTFNFIKHKSKKFNFIYYDSDSVGSVHLGIYIEIEYADVKSSNEENIIDNVKYIDLKTLGLEIQENNLQFETWSLYYIRDCLKFNFTTQHEFPSQFLT